MPDRTFVLAATILVLFNCGAHELLSKVVDGKFSGGGLLEFDSVDELGALNHVG